MYKYLNNTGIHMFYTENLEQWKMYAKQILVDVHYIDLLLVLTDRQ